MNVNKVDFLNDLNETINYLKSNLTETSEILKFTFYTPGTTDDQNIFEINFKTFDVIPEYFQTINYDVVEKITLVLKDKELIKTIHCDKKNNMIAITDNQKNELNEMVKETDYSMIKDDGCTYYEFEYGIIGKYNPLTSSYYLYDDNEWKLSGSVMRWVEDPAYQCKIVKEPNKTK